MEQTHVTMMDATVYESNIRFPTDVKLIWESIVKVRQLQEQKSAMRSVLSTVRATVLEGSFGNEKNHYLLNKIKAKTEATEIAWIFFGILTANASIISKRIINKQLKRTG